MLRLQIIATCVKQIIWSVAMHNAEIVCTVRIDYKFSEQIT